MRGRVCTLVARALVCAAGFAAAPEPALAQTALPGTIQAEDFDQGGAGATYLDTSSGNSGGQYRSTDVDIEACADAGGGYNVGWIVPGEWLRYSVVVAAAGTYTVEVRVASLGRGGTFHIEVDGSDVTGPLTIPDTGGWQTWTTVTRTGVWLPAGAQVWRLVSDAVGDPGIVGNYNYIRVSQTGSAGSAPFGGTPVALPGTFEGENFDNGGAAIAYHDLTPANQGGEYRATSVDIEPAADSGGGYNVGWLVAGEWMNYTVNVGSTGTYNVDVRVASQGPGGTFHIEVNGTDRTGPFTIPDTGGWQTWTTIRKTGLQLTAGPQVWRIVVDTNGPSGAVGNINFVRVQSAGGTAPPPGGNGDIVLYASDVTNISGNWARVGSSSGAGGETMRSDDRGWASASHPVAAPEHYFEAQFVPEANRAYRLWLRLRAGGNSKFNESVWVQFGGAVDAGGTPLWRIGTTHGLLVNLEACGGCGVSSWGWQNRAWWLADDPVVRFPSATTQTIRVQTREDGVDIDQIVLSPTTYWNASPGRDRDDTTVVSKSGGGAGNQPPTSAITSPASGATYTAPASITINATAGDGDGSVTRVEFHAGSTLIGSDTTAPYSVTWTGAPPGSHGLSATAYDNSGASTRSATVSVTVNGAPAPAPTIVVFTPSIDHATGVTSYVVSVYRAGDPVTAQPVAQLNIGKPTVSNDEIQTNISSIVNPLPGGSYYAAVTAVGPGGSAVSTPSASFTR